MMHRSIYGMLGWTAIFAMASLLTAICFLIAPEQSVAWSWHIHLLGDAGLCFMLTTAALMLAWPVHHLAPWYAAARSLRRWVMRVWMPASLTVSRLPPTASSLTIATSIVHMMIMQLAVWHVPLFATIISAFLCVSSVVLIHRLSMVHRSSSQSLWSLYRLERRGRYRQTALWDATIVMLGMASTITASMITGQMHVFVMAAYVLRMSMHYAMMRAISRRHGSLKTVVPTPVPGA
jgi:hypothetical protein